MNPNKFRYVTYEDDGTAIYNTDPYDVYITLDEGHVYSFDGDFVSDVVLQFTGLYDKNGIPIYEGDIIKVEHTFLGVQMAEIKFEEGKFIADGFWMGELDNPNDFTEAIAIVEVVGNIFESNSLLEH